MTIMACNLVLINIMIMLCKEAPEWPLRQRKICQKSGKRGKSGKAGGNQEKSGKRGGESGKLRKKRKKSGRKGKIREGSFTLPLLTDRAGGLATLLVPFRFPGTRCRDANA